VLQPDDRPPTPSSVTLDNERSRGPLGPGGLAAASAHKYPNARTVAAEPGKRLIFAPEVLSP
jgi:hypothetical protein